MRLVYIEKIDLESIQRRDMDLLNYLKRQRTDEYKNMLRDSAAHWKKHRP